MAGTAAAGELSAPPPPAAAPAETRRGAYRFRVAGPRDERAVARVLREGVFDGAIRVAFHGEPDALAAAAVYGPVHQTVIAERDGAVAAIACRAERDVFVNGRIRRMGYLSQLRVAGGRGAGRDLLEGGFEFCRALHDRGSAFAYLMAIVEDNEPARRLLTSARLGGAPDIVPLEPFVTFAIPTRLRSPQPGGELRRGRPDLLPAIADCLQRFGARHQLAPVWTADDLASRERTPGLAAEDFFVLRRGGLVAACVALWDQRPFRQTVVHGYSRRLARMRPLVNLAARAGWTPRLPPAGTALAFAYLSHAAFDDDPRDLLPLIDAARTAAGRAGLEFLVLGAAERHPLAAAVAARFRHRRYVSRLYLARWPGDETPAALDGRIPAPEVAVL